MTQNSKLKLALAALISAPLLANAVTPRLHPNRLINPANRPAAVTNNAVNVILATLRRSQQNEVSSGTWQPLKNQHHFTGRNPQGKTVEAGAGNPLLLTDGSVIVQNIGNSAAPGSRTSEIWKLSPDNTGSYVNGTWSQLASLPAGYAPLAHASAVLPDGRVIFEGGEHNGDEVMAQTRRGAIYDPVANSWTEIAPPTFFNSPVLPAGFQNIIGDAASVVLPDGTFMLMGPYSNKSALLNPDTLQWTETGSDLATPVQAEQGWTLLPSGDVLTIDTYAYYGALPGFPPFPANATGAQAYNPATGAWSSAGNTTGTLTTPVKGATPPETAAEMGTASLRPDGTVFATGVHQNTSIYDYRSNTWSAGPNFPAPINGFDAPSAILPNGNVLLAIGPGGNTPPLLFTEFNGTNFVKPSQIPTISTTTGTTAANFLVLPTGQILLTVSNSNIQIYTPDAESSQFNPEWAPVINDVPRAMTPGGSYEISGVRFNGMTQGCFFGDDVQCATNYPLVRLTNVQTGDVAYARTFNHSSMAVASNDTVSTNFEVPAGLENGIYNLQVVANGIPSDPEQVAIGDPESEDYELYSNRTPLDQSQDNRNPANVMQDNQSPVNQLTDNNNVLSISP